VRAHQRERLLRAVCRACADRGYESVTVADIVREARVSRRAFYAHYSCKEDCFLDGFTTLLARFRRRVGAAVAAAGSDWLQRVAVGLAELLRALEEQPDAARTLFVDALSGGPRVIRQRQRALRECAAELSLPHGAPKELAESVVGATVEVIFATVLEGRVSGLVSLHEELLYCMLVPLIGHDEAQAGLARARAFTKSSS
jgi:AcrR family transcriptional regulator